MFMLTPVIVSSGEDESAVPLPGNYPVLVIAVLAVNLRRHTGFAHIHYRDQQSTSESARICNKFATIAAPANAF